MRIQGGRYACALPSGEWAALMPGQHILTHQGRVALPGFDILELTLTNIRGFELAGKAQQEPSSVLRGTWHYHRERWHHYSYDAHGSYSAIFDQFGYIIRATPEGNGSQGWRYVAEDGRLVTGDQTYNGARWADAGFSPAVDGLWEFSYLGGVFIGQGETGCDVLIDGQRRRLLDGDTRFIRVTYDQERDIWGIGITRLREQDAHVYQMSRADLKALPLITQTPVPPTPPPVTPPELPPPMPEIPAALDNQLALVTEVRNTLFPDRVGQPLNDPAKAMLFTKHVAWRLREHGVGLVRAKVGSGNNVDGYTSDIVALRNGVHWDIQIDGHTGAAFPTWALVEDPENYPPIAARWVPAVDPEPPPVDDTLVTRVEQLELIVKQLNIEAAVRREVTDLLIERMGLLIERIEALERQPTAPLPKLRVKGSTSRSFGHGHQIDLEVVEDK